jgi:C4-dicarboxylate-specific signal transduction histidine kinase
VLNAELERRVVERTEELAHAKEQLLRMLALAHREDLQPECSMFPH